MDAKLGVSDAGAAGVEEGLGKPPAALAAALPAAAADEAVPPPARRRRRGAFGGGPARARSSAPARVDADVSAAGGALEAMDPEGRASSSGLRRSKGQVKDGSPP